MKELILKVVARSAEELTKHTAGPGTRYVFSDHKNNPEGNIYTIMRLVKDVERPEQHVEPHNHDFESLFIFKGNNPDFSGLEVEVLLGDQWYRIESPKALSFMITFKASSASPIELAMKTPFPAASPSAFITIGVPLNRIYSSACR